MKEADMALYLWARFSNDNCTWKELPPHMKGHWISEAQRLAMQFDIK